LLLPVKLSQTSETICKVIVERTGTNRSMWNQRNQITVSFRTPSLRHLKLQISTIDDIDTIYDFAPFGERYPIESEAAPGYFYLEGVGDDARKYWAKAYSASLFNTLVKTKQGAIFILESLPKGEFPKTEKAARAIIRNINHKNHRNTAKPQKRATKQKRKARTKPRDNETKVWALNELTEDTMGFSFLRCLNCGIMNNPSAQFCRNCGKKLAH
jgi:hypothetical protein